MGKKPTREPLFIIRDLQTLKVFSDPLRLQIMEQLYPEPQTINKIADELGLSSSRLYYHFNQLEAHGLISVVDTQVINNIIEKVYWVIAKDIDIDKDLLNFSSENGQENVENVIRSSLEVTRQDILRSIHARKIQLGNDVTPNPRNMVMAMNKKRLNDETYQAFVDQCQTLAKQFDALPEASIENEGANTYGFAFYLYPSYTYDQGKKDVHEDAFND